MAQKNYWIKSGFWTFSDRDQKNNGGLSIRRVVKWVLKGLNVAFWDDCCPEDDQTLHPVRFNTTSEPGVLEYFDGTEWVEVPAAEPA